MGFVHPRATVISSAPSRRGVFTFGHITGGPAFNTRGNLNFHHHHFPHSFLFASPFFGFGAFDPFFDDYWSPYSFGPYGYDPYASMGTYTDSDLSGQISNLSSQVQQLQNENDSLQAELEEDRQPPVPAASSSDLSSSEPPTVLVFNDGHQLRVQNYAIVGQTLWILSDNRASKVPLADLDLTQTIKLNEDRGIEFLGPSSVPK